ncbi:hypothetical protein MG293_003517 [Ovis ammon polii]|uniref:Uncharacterized protein n=1 Tax=Ovis ammon polii TaxID=230172 RepID=A0AAD4UI34_OVIAM|nr:hypothetical protein MG293_003517 [Ovis ammon polii]
MCVQVRSQMLAYQEGILVSHSWIVAVREALGCLRLCTNSCPFCCGSRTPGDELPGSLFISFSYFRSYIAFDLIRVDDLGRAVCLKIEEVPGSAWAPVSSDFRVAPVTSTMERKMNRDGVMGQAAMFYPIYSLENLVCDNLGGNKPALSSAKERASLRLAPSFHSNVISFKALVSYAKPLAVGSNKLQSAFLWQHWRAHTLPQKKLIVNPLGYFFKVLLLYYTHRLYFFCFPCCSVLLINGTVEKERRTDLLIGIITRNPEVRSPAKSFSAPNLLIEFILFGIKSEVFTVDYKSLSLNKTFCSQNMGGISTVESEADHLSGGSTSEEQLANVSTFVIKSSVLMAAGNTTRGENPMFCADFPPNLLTLMPASPSPHAFSLRSFTVKASAGLTSGKSVGAVSKASALMLHTLA